MSKRHPASTGGSDRGDRRRSLDRVSPELKQLQRTNLDERDRLALLHDISVYQDELMAQNEALVRAQTELEETRDQFIELYDFAPTGYLTLDTNGVIRRCNLAAAAFLGRSRPALHDIPLFGFVARSSRKRYMEFLRRCRSQGGSAVEVELLLQTHNGLRDVQLLCRPQRGRPKELFTSMVDITERKQLERERQQTAEELEALTNRLLTAIDDERQRISRDLHDDVGQQLTAIRMMFETALHHDGGIDPAQLRAVQQVIEHLDRRLHTVAAQLRPAALDVGVVTAIDLLLREWSTTFDIGSSLDVQRLSDADVPNSVATHLYRILQEALNNVAKHGAATKVDVRLHKRRGEIVLVVEDNGRGFDIEGARGRSSPLGLIGMRERAQLMGGRMQIQSRPGQGTSIVVSVPIP